MPSSFMAKRNYAHCPLKKRPLAALYEQEEPEDLSIKKPKLEELCERVVPKVEQISSIDSYTTSSAALTPPPASPSPPSLSSSPEGFASSIFEQKPIVQRSSVSPALQHIPVQSYNLSVHSSVNNSYASVSSNRHVLPMSTYSLSVPVRQRTFIPPVATNSFNTKCKSTVSTTSSPPVSNIPPRNTSTGPTTPNLAEYYLQLFRATSEAESARQTWLPPAHMPPSPQTSPRSPLEQFNQLPSNIHLYPDSSALISPASSISTISESEEEPLSPTGSVSSSSSTSGTTKTRYSCSECGKAYATRPGLAKHKELHCTATLGARAYSCPTCNKSYTSCGALKMHIRTHTLPCKCHVCGKAFSRPWLLQGHIRTHTGEKPFQCTECCRSFADRSNLRAHQQTHATVKKYACAVCTKTFSRMSLLNKHREGTCTPGCPDNDIEEEEEELDVVGDENTWSQQ